MERATTPQIPKRDDWPSFHTASDSLGGMTCEVETRRVQLLPAWRSSARCRCLVALTAAVVVLLVVGAIAFLVSTDGKTRRKLIEIGSVPIVAALVGWGTNVVALQMTFYPLEFHGFCPNLRDPIFGMPLLGWQGIIPSRGTKMAGMAVDLMTTRLIDVKEVFSRMDPARIAAELEAPLEKLVPKILELLTSSSLFSTGIFSKEWTPFFSAPLAYSTGQR